MMKFQIEDIDWKKMQGLVPVIVQDDQTYQVLMLAYMNQEALLQTLQTKKVTFFSRSKEKLWVKGETSNHYLELIDLQMDCDCDALLVLVKPQGPTCHLGNVSCFSEAPVNRLNFLTQLELLIEKRDCERPQNSYTSELLNAGVKRIAQKVGEEGVEVALAAVSESNENFANECVDLLYHLLILMRQKRVLIEDVLGILEERMFSHSP